MFSGALCITLLPDVSTTDSLPLTSTSLSLLCVFVCSPVLTAALPRQLQRPEIDGTLHRCAWNIGTSSLGWWHKNSQQETNADPCYLFIYNNGLTLPRSPLHSWLFREKSEWVIPSNFLLPIFAFMSPFLLWPLLWKLLWLMLGASNTQSPRMTVGHELTIKDIPTFNTPLPVCV